LYRDTETLQFAANPAILTRKNFTYWEVIACLADLLKLKVLFNRKFEVKAMTKLMHVEYLNGIFSIP
jgi:hypothetical protein